MVTIVNSNATRYSKFAKRVHLQLSDTHTQLCKLMDM